MSLLMSNEGPCRATVRQPPPKYYLPHVTAQYHHLLIKMGQLLIADILYYSNLCIDELTPCICHHQERLLRLL